MFPVSQRRFEKKYILSQFKDVVFHSDYAKKKFNVYKTIKLIKRGTASKYFTEDRIDNIKIFFRAAGVSFKS
jgi:hypothetical protein